MINNIAIMQAGMLTVICGPMFAGKTEELIRQINILRRAQKNVAVFLPKLAQRYSENKIVSHNQRSIKTHVIANEEEMWAILNQTQYDAVCFDEVQFFSKTFFSDILKLIMSKKIVICAGMDKDFYGQYVGLMARLLVQADIIYKLSAICMKCNSIATRTQRVDSNQNAINTYKPKILIGGANFYEARCNRCFVWFSEDE